MIDWKARTEEVKAKYIEARTRAEKAEQSLDELARAVGQALCVPTLAEGEELTHPIEHAVVSSALGLLRRAREAEATLARVRLRRARRRLVPRPVEVQS